MAKLNWGAAHPAANAALRKAASPAARVPAPSAEESPEVAMLTPEVVAPLLAKNTHLACACLSGTGHTKCLVEIRGTGAYDARLERTGVD